VVPVGANLSGLEGTFRDEQVGTAGKGDSVVADTGVRAVGDHLPVDLQPVAVTGGRMDKRTALHGEGELVHTFSHLDDPDRVREFCERDGERFPGKGVEEGSTAREAVDRQAFLKPELDEDMEPGNMVDVEMGKEEEDRLLLRDVPVRFGNTVAGIEDDVKLFRLDKDRGGVTGGGIEPAIGAKEGHLHGTRVVSGRTKRGAAVANLFILRAGLTFIFRYLA
jgi:hypothetical protein